MLTRCPGSSGSVISSPSAVRSPASIRALAVLYRSALADQRYAVPTVSLKSLRAYTSNGRYW